MFFFKLIDKIDHGRPGVIIPIVLVSLFLGIPYYYTQQYRKQLYNSNIVTSGIIYDHTPNGRSSGRVIHYRFSIGAIDYTNTQTVYRIDLDRHKYLGKTFPVIYEKGNPEHNELLLLPEQFQNINVPFPDSLKWVLE